ncbi:MAG: peptide chain release factor-like protein, partial [Parcubacteria group bacterium]
KNESGVHRLVRISPFNAKSLRHTSFSMVEVIPKFDKPDEVKISPEDIKTEYSKSSGPGGQNVNKRETAVRLVHIPTNLAVHVESERSQAQNREKAERMLEAKLYKLLETERLAKEKGMYVSKTTQIEWGNQIRSYVLHPYKMVKDHRTNVEVRDVEKVLNGDIEAFLEAEKNL